MPKNIKKEKLKDQNISYLNRDFSSMRNDLVRYAQTHYGDRLVDYTQSSLAGLLVDLAAYVGDVMSFYLDHNFNELNIENAVEEENILALAREYGVEFTGASPAVVPVLISLRIPSKIKTDGSYEPDRDFLPKIQQGTVVESNTGIAFELLDTIDFGEEDEAGDLVFNQTPSVSKLDTNNNPTEFIVIKEGIFTSSRLAVETFFIDSQHIPFRRITLSNGDVSEVTIVTDEEGEEYFEVKALTQDTIFKREKNINVDTEYVSESLILQPAPRRYIKQRSRETGQTTLIFGAGDEDVFDEDVIPDPSEHAIKLYGERKTLNVVSIDPNSFLGTSTLGISPRNTTLTVRYRHGGGLHHNVDAGTIRSVESLNTKFKTTVPTSVAARIRASVSCINNTPASGGENELALEQIRTAGILSQLSQDRVVSREDLIARVYSMPSNFGKVFRAACRNNPNNPFSSHLHIISRDSSGKLINSTDTLKNNIKTYLSRHRLVGDAVDIVDTRILNIGVNYVVTLETSANSIITIQTINYRLKKYFKLENWQIDQPLYKSELVNIILNTEGVISMLSLEVVNYSGSRGSNVYSEDFFSPNRYTVKDVIYPPPGSLIEVKFPNDDIIGKVS